MKRFVAALLLLSSSVTLLAAPLVGEAQQPAKVYRVGIMSPTRPSNLPQFLQALRELGYVEGQNLVVEGRFADGQQDRLPAFAAELVALRVDVIVTYSNPAARAAKQATPVIPVVFMIGANPVRLGLIASLARPGGNVTGVTNMLGDIEGKRWELLKEVVPRASRAAYLADANYAGWSSWDPAPARALGLQVQLLGVKGGDDFKGAFEAAARGRADALFVEESALMVRYPAEIAAGATAHRLPAIGPFRMFAEAGLLMSFGANVEDMDRRHVALVDKILKGAKPADLPVEQPTRFDLVLNLKTAKVLGLTIPPSVRIRATEVIE
jgi:putative ABC transport system substrate-binding protein